MAGIRDAGIPLTEVAALAAHLPAESAVVRATVEHWYRTPEVDILRELEHGVRVLAWQQMGKKATRSTYPERIPLPWDPKPEPAFKSETMSWDEAADFLDMPEMRDVKF